MGNWGLGTVSREPGLGDGWRRGEGSIGLACFGNNHRPFAGALGRLLRWRSGQAPSPDQDGGEWRMEDGNWILDIGEWGVGSGAVAVCGCVPLEGLLLLNRIHVLLLLWHKTTDHVTCYFTNSQALSKVSTNAEMDKRMVKCRACSFGCCACVDGHSAERRAQGTCQQP